MDLATPLRLGLASSETSCTRKRCLAARSLPLLAALALVFSGAAAMAQEVTPSEPLRPWEPDAASMEAARKIAFHEKMDLLGRWAQEPTPDQIAMDARYYRLELSIDPNAQTVSGSVIARFTVLAASSNRIVLDLVNALAVSGVTMNGGPVPFTHANELLTVTLDRTYLQGETAEIQVTYAGTPPASPYNAFGFDEYAGEPMIWSLSEPFGARSWWPCDDWSDDKADAVDLAITVPAGLVVASNGRLESVAHQAVLDTYHWHEGHPIATYLVSLAIHPYTVYSDYRVDGEGDSLEVQFYMFADDVEACAELNAMVVPMIAAHEEIFGPYPFADEKYGHAEFLWGGGMEHQTCTSLGAFSESIIAHELAHQWWGDMVTCANFEHVWLNEGFARYSEALWYEHAYGIDAYQQFMDGIRYYGSGTIHVPDLSDWGRIFSTDLTYNKAGWVVHMLRGAMGDEDFFAFLPAWRAAFEYGSATTEDLCAVAESVAGMDLDDFFQQWIYGEYYPVYEFEWDNATGPGGDELVLAIDQTQTNTGPFHMPIRMRATLAGGGTHDFTIDNAAAHQEYRVSLPAPATDVALDPDNWILKRVLDPVRDPNFRSGVLLVNGCDWDAYGSELLSAYNDRAFWGDLEISFWDYFTKSGPYPITLPAPLGHGRVPASVLEDYLAVIWVGNNYSGDLNGWYDTSIASYLEAGGNVLLMTRMGDRFLDAGLRDYLGIQVTGTDQTLYDCISVDPQLVTMARAGTQSYNITFNRTLTQPTSRLLFEARQNYNPDVGIGVIRVPTEGGTHNPKGGQFAFLSGRPYRWNHAALAANVETIIGWIQQAWASAPDPGEARAEPRLRLAAPSSSRARVEFFLPSATHAQLRVYDTTGRLIDTLLDEDCESGGHVIEWDGRTAQGESAPAGMYFVRLSLPERTLQGKTILIR